MNAKHYTVILGILMVIGIHLQNMTQWSDFLMVKNIGELAIGLATSLGAMFVCPPTASTNMTVDTKRFAVLILALSLFGLSSACGGLRHTLVTANKVPYVTIAAIDDAQFPLCHPVSQGAWCDATDPLIKKALVDERAVAAAIQSMPKNGGVPTSLVDLIADLVSLNNILTPLQTVGGPVGTVAQKVTAALSQSSAQLSSLLGVQP